MREVKGKTKKIKYNNKTWGFKGTALIKWSLMLQV